MPTEISFRDIEFKSTAHGVKALFMKNYYFELANDELESIGSFQVLDGKIIFDEREKRVWNKFNMLLAQGFERLRHRVRDKACLYVHRESGIPLIGTNEFGLVDRGSNIIEVKPLTGCNLSCNFCSVNEGVNNKTDIVVEEEYLIEGFVELVRNKKHPVEANIGPQGEPLLYPRLVDLVRDLKAHGAAVVSINTNGTLFTEEFIDELAHAGLDRINLSLHGLDQVLVKEMMQGHQDVERLVKIIEYCEGKIDVLLAPVLIPGVNDGELDKLIALSKHIKNKHWPSMGIQNFLDYKGGRNPGVIPRSWEEFYELLRRKEREHAVKLILRESDNPFKIFADQSPQKPFKKGQVISARVVAVGRNKQEVLAESKNRCITVKNCSAKIGTKITIELLRDKHNIYTAIPR